MFYILLYLVSVCLFGYYFCRIMDDIGEDSSFIIMFICALFWPFIIVEALYKVYKNNRLDGHGKRDKEKEE